MHLNLQHKVSPRSGWESPQSGAAEAGSFMKGRFAAPEGNGFLQDAALAFELAAKFYLNAGWRRPRASIWRKPVSITASGVLGPGRTWKRPILSGSLPGRAVSQQARLQRRNWMWPTVVKASQAVSEGNRHTAELIERLMTIAFDNAWRGSRPS